MRTRVVLCCLFLLLNAFDVRSSEKTIYITNGEWEPYLSEHSPHYGAASHIVEEAFKLEGIKVVWGFFPWIRSYELAKEGKQWHASAVWWPTKDAKHHFLLSSPVVKTSNVFFCLKTNKFNWNSFDDISGFRVGVTRGYDYGEEFRLAVESGKITVEEVSSDEINLKKLLSRRIDIFPNDPLVGLAQIRNNFNQQEIESITFHPRKFEQTTLHLLISKNSPYADQTLSAFNNGLSKLKKSGKLQEILNDVKSGNYDGSKK